MNIRTILSDLAPLGLIRLNQLLRSKLYGNISSEEVPEVDKNIEDGLERHFKRISFEISNTCNYTSIHDRCPVSCYVKSVTLDKNVVHKIIDELGEYNYDGFIAFHRYNEPMINKERLYSYIAYVNEVLPNAKITLLTNGSYLFQEEMNRFESLQLWSISVSAYSKKEYKRLKELTTNIRYNVFYSFLDNRKSIYDREPIDLKMPCFATLRDITVNCFGHISLCCYDWNNQVTFGSLREQSLKEILNSDEFLKAHKELTNGIRNFDICRRCNTCR